MVGRWLCKRSLVDCFPHFGKPSRVRSYGGKLSGKAVLFVLAPGDVLLFEEVHPCVYPFHLCQQLPSLASTGFGELVISKAVLNS